MKIQTEAKYIRISPKKLRLVADVFRGMNVQSADESLSFMEKRAAGPLRKALKTAVADAVNTFKLRKETLIIKTIDVNEGPSFKRWRAVARGTAHPYKRRTSHIRIVLEEMENKSSTDTKKTKKGQETKE